VPFGKRLGHHGETGGVNQSAIRSGRA
jgi:hypothetical protein